MDLTIRARPQIGVIALLTMLGSIAPAQSVTYIGGTQYAAGGFGYAQRTWSAYLSNGLTWASDRMRVTATVPVIVQSTGMLQYSGAGMMVSRSSTGDSMNTTSRMHGSSNGMGMGMGLDHLGLGDPLLRIEAAILRSPAAGTLAIVGAAKAPLADASRGFGTGRWDAGAGLSGVARAGPVFLFGDAVYWNIGNPLGGSARDALAFTVSAGRPLRGGRWSALAVVSGATSLWSGLPAPIQAGVSVGRTAASERSWFLTTAVGLTASAPDASIGIGWRVPLGVKP